MTIHKFVSDMQKQNKIQYDEKELYNKTREYVKNVFCAIGVGLGEFRMAMGLKTPYAYNVSPRLQEILKEYVISCSFPTLKQMKRFIEENNICEIIKMTEVIKCFLDENFNSHGCYMVRNRVRDEIKNIERRIEKIKEEYDEAIVRIEQNTLFSLMLTNCLKYVEIAKNMLSESYVFEKYMSFRDSEGKNEKFENYQKILNLVKIYKYLYESRVELEKTSRLNKLNFSL